MADKKKKGTETSSFGVSQRSSHDSSLFYASKLYEGKRIDEDVQYEENEVPKEYLNKIFCSSSERMNEIPDSSVHLMVTSPPYNACKEYDKDFTLEEYLNLLQNVFQEVYRVLVPGGRACINIANLGRKPYIPLHAYVIEIMEKIGYIMRGEVIWDKQTGGGTAWGSWKSPANPVLRDQHEYILIFCKDTLSRRNPYHRKSTITKKEFLDFTRSIWAFPPESATSVGHPAPFPEELPYRLIQLFTFQDEVILDPFIGSGTSGLAALKTKRNYIGYDIESDYINIARKRIDTYLKQRRFDFD